MSYRNRLRRLEAQVGVAQVDEVDEVDEEADRIDKLLHDFFCKQLRLRGFEPPLAEDGLVVCGKSHEEFIAWLRIDSPSRTRLPRYTFSTTTRFEQVRASSVGRPRSATLSTPRCVPTSWPLNDCYPLARFFPPVATKLTQSPWFLNERPWSSTSPCHPPFLQSFFA